MRYDVGHETEEGPFTIRLQEFERLFLNQLRRVNAFLSPLVLIEYQPSIVVPEVIGIVVVGDPLAIVAKEEIEAINKDDQPNPPQKKAKRRGRPKKT